MDHENSYYGRLDSGFERNYRCYPVSFIEKPHLEKGDKIIMPPSALDSLASLHIDYPMLFELSNSSAERLSHCGVMEFVADEGIIYMPYWMMENMLLQEGSIVHVKNVTLPKGTYVKLQPHTKDFLDISNPKAILETALRNYSCLTVGDTIVIPYNNKNYHVNIVEAKPSDAVSIIETDCEVDFAPPLDYVEPVKPALVPSVKAAKEEEPTKEDPEFVSFTGVGRRLDGKPCSLEGQTASTIVKPQKKEVTNGVAASSASTSSNKRSGKLVFGSDAGQPSKTAKKVDAKDKSAERQNEVPQKEEKKFQAFTGKGYSLKG